MKQEIADTEPFFEGRKTYENIQVLYGSMIYSSQIAKIRFLNMNPSIHRMIAIIKTKPKMDTLSVKYVILLSSMRNSIQKGSFCAHEEKGERKDIGI